MGTLLEKGITSSTYRIIPEPDPERGKWVDFAGMSLSDQWLRHGRNPNIRTDTSAARSPFVVSQGLEEIEGYDRGVNFLFAPPLLSETSTNCFNLSRMVDSDTGNVVLVGEIDNKKGRRRTIPVVIIGRETGGRREVAHTFIPKALPRRDRSLL